MPWFFNLKWQFKQFKVEVEMEKWTAPICLEVFKKEVCMLVS